MRDRRGARARRTPVLEGLIEGLRTLEYRGYDSAGVAVADGAADRDPAQGGPHRAPRGARSPTAPWRARTVGIGHTRWATHGPPSDENAHPHTDGDGRVALVHNGIIENYLELRARARRATASRFRSETDTEVLAHLIGRELERGAAPGRGGARERCGAGPAATTRSRRSRRRSGRELVCARQGPPLVVARRRRTRAWLASDVLALILRTRATSSSSRTATWPSSRRARSASPTSTARASSARVRHIDWDAEAAEQGRLRALHAQGDPRAARRARAHGLRPHAVESRATCEFEDAAASATRDLRARSSASQVVACGTALHAGCIARYLIEGLARRAGRRRLRLGVPLPRPAPGARHAGAGDLAVGRDRRHAGGAAPGARARRARRSPSAT